MVQTPSTSETQQYLQDVARVLAIATEIVGDEKRATLLMYSTPLGTFGNKTADALIQEGRTETVIAYLQSIASGYGG